MSKYPQDITLPAITKLNLDKTNFTNSMKTDSASFQYFNAKKIKERIFSHTDNFNADTLQIVSSIHLKYDHDIITITNKIIDYTHGVCGETFLLERSHFGYSIQIIQESTSHITTIPYSHFVNPSKILNSDHEIFVLDDDTDGTSHILAFSKTDRHISYDFTWDSKIIDMTIYNDKVFFLAEQKNKTQLFSFENNVAKKITVTDHHLIDGANLISGGILDEKLYLLFGAKHLAVLDDSKLIQFELPKISGNILHFSVLDYKLILINSKTPDSLNVYLMRISNNALEIIEEHSWSDADNAKIVSSDKVYISKQESSISNKILSFNLISHYQNAASFVLSPIDSCINSMKWHRIQSSLFIPPKTSIELSVYATNDESLIPKIHDFKSNFLNPHDALIKGEEGRFLWLQFTLHSLDYTYSPKINDFTVHLPHAGLIQYLPQIYQTGEGKDDFLERFLALFEIYTGKIDGLLNHFTSYLWPDSAPKECLPWLTTILGLKSSYDLPEDALRELLKELPSLNRNRGTKVGMLRWLDLYFKAYNIQSTEKDTAKKFWIFENYNLNGLNNNNNNNNNNSFKFNAYLKNLTSEYLQLFGNDNSVFHVFVNHPSLDSSKRSVLGKIINDQKPAFTQSQIHFLENRIILGHHTYLGINTYASMPKLTLGDSILGVDTILYESDALHNNA